MQIIIKDCVFYVAFLTILMLTAYTYVDYRSYYQNNNVQKMFLGDFPDIKLKEDIIKYVNETFIPNLYPTECYNSEATCELIKDKYTSDPQLWRMRNGQLRQVRIMKEDECHVPKPMDRIIGHCRSGYSLWSEETRAFRPGWVLMNASEDEMSTSQEWRFTSTLDVYGYPYSGYLAMYGGGGYMASLGETFTTAVEKFQTLVDNNWLDVYTRGFSLEFTLYNPGTNLYTVSLLLIEQFEGGGYITTNHFYTLRLDRYYGVMMLFYMVMDIVSGVFVFIFIIKEILELKRRKCEYFQSFWNLLDFGLVISAIVMFAFFIMQFVAKSGIVYMLKKYPDRYISFQYLLFCDNLRQFFLGMVVFIYTMRFLRMLTFNRKMSMLGEVLKKSVKPLFGFTVMFLIIFFSFVTSGYLLFFTTVLTFRDVSSTIQTLGVMSLNKFDFTTFSQGAGTLGYAFFFIYMLFISFVMVNFFITIVTESFTKVKEDWNEQQNEYELVEYITTTLKSIFGCRDKTVKDLDIDRRFQYLEDTVDQEQVYENMNDRVNQLILVLRRYLQTEANEENQTATKSVEVVEGRDDDVPIQGFPKRWIKSADD